MFFFVTKIKLLLIYTFYDIISEIKNSDAMLKNPNGVTYTESLVINYLVITRCYGHFQILLKVKVLMLFLVKVF